MSGRGPLTGVVTAGQGSLASKAARKTGFPGGSLFAAAARKSGNPGGGYLARKSGWPGGGAFPVPDSEGEEEDEEEEDSQEDSQEEGGDSGEEEEQEEEGQEGGGRQHEGAGAQVADDRPVADALMDALEAAEAPGDFATGGKMRLVLPGLELLSSSGSDGGSSSGDGDNGGDGSGGGAGISRGGGGGGKAEVIGLPLSEAAAAALKAACELAPFGRRDKTLRDTKVRHTWQLDPAGFQLSNPQWQKAVEQVAAQCCDALGVPKGTAVEAQLYKLLLYEQGSHFSVHRDTEKAENMWGTLVVHLPTAYKGGQLVVSHAGRSKTFDFSGGSAYGMHYAAFYADCNHEIKAVTAGHRLVLIYNLVSKAGAKLPQLADCSDAANEARAVVQRWERELEQCQPDAPIKLVYILEHLYSQDGLRPGLAALKGADRCSGRVMAKLQQEGLVDAHFALVQRDDWGGDGEYNESEQKLSEWVGLDGRPAPELGTMQLDEELELCQGPNYFEETDPDGEEEEPDTGNEGAPCSRWYRRTALVVWPKSRRYDVRCGDDLKQAAEGLLKAVRKSSQPPAEPREWAAALLRALPRSADPAFVAAVVRAVAKLRDAQLAEQCLAALSKAGTKQKRYLYTQSSGPATCITPEHAPAIVQLCHLAGWSQPSTSAVQLLLTCLAKGQLDALPSCAALLRQLQSVATAPVVAATAAEAAAPGAAAADAAAAAGDPAAAPGDAAAAAADAAAGSTAAGAAAAAAALVRAGLTRVISAAASLPRADAPVATQMVPYEVSRVRGVQARGGAGLAQLLRLLLKLGDEQLLDSILATAYARQLTAASAAADAATAASSSASSSSGAAMLPPLLTACKRLGWDSPRTAAALAATATGCAASLGSSADFFELTQEVQEAAGQAAAVLVPQITAAFLQALPPAPPPNVSLNRVEEARQMQVLLDWLAEHGSGEHLGALLTRAASSTLSLQPAVDLAVRAGPTKGWWAELQPGLLAAFGTAHSEADMPAVLGQLRRVQQASGVCGRAEAGGAAVSAASVQRYVQLAAAVMGVLEREPDKDMTPRPPPVGHYRGRYHSTAYNAPPNTPPHTADFVQDLLLAIYVPDCPDSAELLARAAAHLCRCSLRYPVASLVLPALEGFAQQLRLGSLAAAVQAVPALRGMVQQAANALRAQIPRPPPLPTDWSRRAEAPRVRCGATRCQDCPAVRAFLEHAQQAERCFSMGATRRKHLASALNRAGSIPGFSWRDDGAAIVCSKRELYEAALADYNRKHAAWQQLQAALGSGGAQAGGGGSRAAQAAPQQQEVQQQQPQQAQQQQQPAAAPSNVIDLTGDSPAAKKRRL